MLQPTLEALAPNLMLLDLSFCDFGDGQGRSALMTALSSLSGLTHLDLQYCDLGSQDDEHLDQERAGRQLHGCLSLMRVLRHLDLQFNRLGSPGISLVGGMNHQLVDVD